MISNDLNHRKKLNYGVMMNSCSNNNWGVPDNSPQETDQIFQSIDVISRATLLDRRFILAILLQETKGCVRVHTTFSADGVRNQGLMQSHNGKSTCNSGTWGAPKDLLEPCPEAKILGMIYEGVVGASEDPDDVSLLKMITRSALGSVGDLYRAARMYNSGPEASLWNLEDGGAANGSYASDVANRMTGWVG
ncbi:hypothetical protein OIDMADRAFT_122110 [Oidiodendron maius Zn]|uniref:Transglycosylase SLT domain-containing protein n=1 Tax=Oidiodendron maius (strain Zn) TaxID=913774 RepID=A0A0C3HF26_OIDMZ|nr:hypothetical protein OIDMADRAFT_122110 [Oidiodendron maius Zn]